MLEARDISLTLRGRPVLTRISAALQPGRVTAIVGPNGAGKSSLLKCLAGLMCPDDGAVALDGERLERMAAREKARAMAFLPQTPEIAWDVDVAHLVGLGRLPWRGAGVEADEAAVARSLDRTALNDFAARKAQRLSGGEQARVHLARMLAGEARWLLLDEPFAALDPAHAFAATRLLKGEAAACAGVVLVVHDLTLAAHIADQVLLLKEGCLLADGPPRAVFTAERLSRAFDAAMRVAPSDDGGLTVTPDWRAD